MLAGNLRVPSENCDRCVLQSLGQHQEQGQGQEGVQVSSLRCLTALDGDLDGTC